MTTITAQLIEAMPPGLDRALMRVLSFHVGRDQAIKRVELMTALSQSGFTLSDDRPVRALINDMRKRGVMICSSGGSNGCTRGRWTSSSKRKRSGKRRSNAGAKVGKLHYFRIGDHNG